MRTTFLKKPYTISEQPQLAQNYMKSLPQTSEFKNILRKIYRELNKFSIVIRESEEEIENLNWDQNERTLVYKIYQRDVVTGINKAQVLVKKLRNFDHTYELRINSQHYKYRILFQFNNLLQSNNYFIILSYGFTKSDEQLDLTDDLSESNDRIKIEIIDEGKTSASFFKWIEEEVI